MNKVDKRIADLVDSGAAYWDGMDGDEPIYKFNFDLVKEQEPELYDALMAEMDADVQSAIDAGLMELAGYDENGEELYVFV